MGLPPGFGGGAWWVAAAGYPTNPEEQHVI